MLKILQRSGFMSFSSQYQVIKGRYLVPAPPKKSPPAYLLFSNDARKNVEGSNTQKLKKLGSMWKELPDQTKQTFEKKAAQLQQAKNKATQLYDKKYRWPFTSINAYNLMMKDFYSKNKFTNIKDGSQALKTFIQQLPEQQKLRYKKEATELTQQKEKLRKPHEIPQSPYNSFNHYLMTLRKRDSKIPHKKQMDISEIQKYEQQYQKQMERFTKKLQNFADKHGITIKELTKLMNKNKDKKQIEAENKRLTADKTKGQIIKLKNDMKKAKERIQKEKKKQGRSIASRMKKYQSEIENIKTKIQKKSQKVTSSIQQSRRLKEELKKDVKDPVKNEAKTEEKNQ